MSKLKLVLSLLGLASLLTSCSWRTNEIAKQAVNQGSSEKPQIASTSVVKVTPAEVVVSKGSSIEGTVRLNIDHGYHINANPPTFPYLKATELEIPEYQGLTVGFVVYPNPITKKFAFAEQSLAVYEGEVVIRVLLKANESAKTGLQKLPAKMRVQACDEEVCYAPGVIDFVIPLNVQ